MAVLALTIGFSLRGRLSIREELAKRERQLDTIAESISDGIYRVSPEEGLIYANRAFAEMFRFGSQEAARQAGPESLYADPEVGRQIWEQARAEGSAGPEEVTFRRRDGTTFYGLLSVTTARAGDGTIKHFDGAITDITERKRQKRRREQTIRRVTDAILEVDSEWRFTLANKQARKLYGVAEGDLLGKDLWEVFSNTLGTRYEEEYRHVMEAREPARFEAHCPELGGWFDKQVYPNEDGGLALYFEEITERKKREESLRKLREKYQGLLEGAPNAIFVADVESGRIVEANQAAALLLGTTVDKITGRYQKELHPSEEADKYEEFFRKSMLEVGRSRTVASQLEDGSQIFVETDSGERVPVEISATLLELEEEEVLIGIFRDITEQISREERLRAAKEEAEEAARLKSSMLANMSHEIRTPLTSIIGFSEAIGKEVQALEECPEDTDLSQIARFAGLIEQGGNRLLDTLDGVLNLSKLEAGHMDLSAQPVDLAEQAERTAEELRPEVESKGLILDVQLDERPVRALADEGGVQVILQNLLSNAIKYTDEGRVAVQAYRQNGAAVLEVEDTGIGMDPEVTEDLFEPFRQASEGINREYEGTGVGLAVTKRAVEEMDGAIKVHTAKGEGSRFVVELPGRSN